MRSTLRKLGYLAALCATVPLSYGSNSQQRVPQSSEPTATTAGLYFPSGVVSDRFGAFFSSYLNRIGEPSLLGAARDPRAVSYRLEWLAGKTGRIIAVRLSLSPDGGARIFAVEQSATPQALHRTENSVSAADVHKFLQLVEKARFWAMPAIESENSDARHRVFKMDASTWVFEGVRNGRYHVVLRQGPDPSPFTEMVRFLEKDLAKLDLHL